MGWLKKAAGWVADANQTDSDIRAQNARMIRAAAAAKKGKRIEAALRAAPEPKSKRRQR